jgi:hypothetical protein
MATTIFALYSGLRQTALNLTLKTGGRPKAVADKGR